jgi:hypothetical protein
MKSSTAASSINDMIVLTFIHLLILKLEQLFYVDISRSKAFVAKRAVV